MLGSQFPFLLLLLCQFGVEGQRRYCSEDNNENCLIHSEVNYHQDNKEISDLEERPDIQLSQYPLLDNQEEPQANIPVNVTLTLECTGNRPIDWYLEHSCCGIGERINVSEKYTPNAGNESFYSKLEIYTSKSTDTGRYFCFYNGTDDYIHKNEKATYQSIYIYVNDPFKKLVYKRKWILAALSSGILVIPCRPTESHLNVTLWKNTEDGDTYVELSDKMYHSTLGFLVYKPTHYFDGTFTCKVGDEISIHYRIRYRHVFGDAPKPIINTKLGFYPMINKPFEIHCYIESQTQEEYDLQWKTPNRNCQVRNCSRITVSDLTTETITRPNPTYKTSIHLTVNRAQREDTGIYSCEAIDKFNYKRNVTTLIVIHG